MPKLTIVRITRPFSEDDRPFTIPSGDTPAPVTLTPSGLVGVLNLEKADHLVKVKARKAAGKQGLLS